jgi:ribosomal protein S18 acetylase RimI-like enzyme
MSTSVVIRPAASSDLGTLISLNAGVQSLHARLEPKHFLADPEPDKVRSFFANLLKAAANRILIAEIDLVSVGYVWFETQNRRPTPFTHARDQLYIHHIAVSENARRRRVASDLMQAVEAEALSIGVKRVVVDTWAANEVAQRFFESQGFFPFNIVLGKDLA